MSDGQSCEAWNHTAELLCLLANCNRDPKRKRHPWHPFDFHPYAKRYGWRKPAPPKTKDLSILKVFVSGQLSAFSGQPDNTAASRPAQS